MGKVDDETQKLESRKKIETYTLGRAVQVQMQERLASFCFLTGFAILMVCDNEESCTLYKQKKIKRHEAVDLFKTALKVSLSINSQS